MPNYGAILSKLKGLKKSGASHWSALCPAHEDRNASLSLRIADDRLLVKCHAGCNWQEIVSAIGCQPVDLFSDDAGDRAAPASSHGEHNWKIADTYDYCDEKGVLLYQVVRFEPKTFRPRRKVNGKTVWNLEGVRRVPYRLQTLLVVPADNRHVWIVEGEKDVDRLVMEGFIATCNVGGAGKWSDDYNGFFRGRHVVIIPDNDEPGHAHAGMVYEALRQFAASVTVVDLPVPPKGDVSDYLDGGHTKTDLVALLKATEATEAAGETRPSAPPPDPEILEPPAEPALPVPAQPPPGDPNQEEIVRAEVRRRMLLFLDVAERLLVDRTRRFFEGLKGMCK